MSPIWRFFADPVTQQRLFVMGAVIVLECLVAVWAATSRRHWFGRALAVWAAVMLMVPIRAWEAAWLFGASSPLIVVLIRAGNWIDQRFTASAKPADAASVGRYRFTLLDLLLLVLFVGLALPGILDVVRHYQPRNWLGWLASSVSIALLAAAACASARTPRQWRHAGLLTAGLLELLVAVWLDFSVLGAIAAAAGLIAYAFAFDRRHWLAMLGVVFIVPICAVAVFSCGQWMRWPMASPPWPAGVWLLVIIEAALVAALTAMLWLALVASNREVRLAGRVIAGLAAAMLIAPPLVRVGGVYRRILAATPPEVAVSKFETPENNHDRIMEIARQVEALDSTAVTYVSRGTMGVQEVWRSTPAPPPVVAFYQELFTLLQSPNAVPYDPATDAAAPFNAGKIQLLRGLMRSLQAEAQVARATDDHARAAELSLAAIRLGDMLSRGGLSVDLLLGEAFRRVGYRQFSFSVDQLSGANLRSSLGVLQRSVQEREESRAILARQRHSDEQASGWYDRFGWAVLYDPNYEYADASIDMAWSELDLTANAVLRGELAVRLFRLESGRLPDSLGELVTAYLPAEPLDPYSQPLRYRKTDIGYLLYSIGVDRTDDGGTFGTFDEYSSTIIAIKMSSPGGRRPPIDFDLKTLTRTRSEPSDNGAP
jgi:hypothetical protein